MENFIHLCTKDITKRLTTRHLLDSRPTVGSSVRYLTMQKKATTFGWCIIPSSIALHADCTALQMKHWATDDRSFSHSWPPKTFWLLAHSKMGSGFSSGVVFLGGIWRVYSFRHGMWLGRDGARLDYNPIRSFEPALGRLYLPLSSYSIIFLLDSWGSLFVAEPHLDLEVQSTACSSLRIGCGILLLLQV